MKHTHLLFSTKQLFFMLLLALISCSDAPQSTGEEAVDSPLVAAATQKTTTKSIDTTYTPVEFLIEGRYRLTIKRDYYNQKDYDDYHHFMLLSGKKLLRDTLHSFISDSKYNKVVNDHGHTFLFIECDGRPNLNYLAAYSIDLKHSTAQFISSAVVDLPTYEPLTDIDGDGYLEYGGFDLTEAHEHRDSMYYHPSSFYEIRNGRLSYDSSLVKAADIKRNGVYLKEKLDKNGYCCTVIKKP